jgi:hypothetical protein
MLVWASPPRRPRAWASVCLLLSAQPSPQGLPRASVWGSQAPRKPPSQQAARAHSPSRSAVSALRAWRPLARPRWAWGCLPSSALGSPPAPRHRSASGLLGRTAPRSTGHSSPAPQPASGSACSRAPATESRPALRTRSVSVWQLHPRFLFAPSSPTSLGVALPAEAGGVVTRGFPASLGSAWVAALGAGINSSATPGYAASFGLGLLSGSGYGIAAGSPGAAPQSLAGGSAAAFALGRPTTLGSATPAANAGAVESGNPTTTALSFAFAGAVAIVPGFAIGSASGIGYALVAAHGTDQPDFIRADPTRRWRAIADTDNTRRWKAR